MSQEPLDLLISVDVETFGPIPGPNSMVNLGAVAYTVDKRKLGSFDMNLSDLPESVRDVSTMNGFWLKPAQAEALKRITKDPIAPATVMLKFRRWIEAMRLKATTMTNREHKPVLVAYPSGFDFQFVYWYWMHFIKAHPPFWFSCIDIKSFAAGKLGVHYNMCGRDGALKPFWPQDRPHSHVGVDDADEQMWLLFNLMDYQKPVFGSCGKTCERGQCVPIADVESLIG